MNCENYQLLISDLVDGTLTAEDCQSVELHLSACPDCAGTRGDLSAIVEFCREHRGEYETLPNERALWVRISNVLETETTISSRAEVPVSAGWWFRLMNRSWQLSFPKLAGLVAGIVLVVSIGTGVSIRNISWLSGSGVQTAGLGSVGSTSVPVEDRYRQQQQAIAYWNQRVEENKARWNAQMRDTFDRNVGVIDGTVAESLQRLKDNPHDTVSEDVLNDALNDKIALLKEFADL
jgi:anti-sigma factor RsiW